MMEINVTRSILIILICAACTLLERAIPFLIFRGREVPRIISYLSGILPMAIMATLVIYCIKDISFVTISGWAPYLISISVTAALQWFVKNTLISIAGGTILYMILIQLVFI